MKELIILCLLVILIILIVNLQNQLTEKFRDVNNYHNCQPYSVVHKPSNSFKTLTKGWCTEKSYDIKVNPDDFDSFEESPVKCQPNYSRVSPQESATFKSKAFCKKPKVY